MLAFGAPLFLGGEFGFKIIRSMCTDPNSFVNNLEGHLRLINYTKLV